MSSLVQQSHHSNSLYVGDLNNDVSEGLLFEFFKRIGPVSSIRVCRDNLTKKSLGYAYVNYVNYEDAKKAIDTQNNSPIKGRNCRIMWQIRDPTLRKTGVGNIFIRNLDPSIGPKELSDTFSQFGNITSVKIATYSNGLSKGYGYVHFENTTNAEQAIKIVNGKKLGDRIVNVTHFIPRADRIKSVESTWTNLYVRNLDLSVTEDEFLDLFKPFGKITSHLLSKNENIELKYGFINFSSHEEAINAMKNRHGYLHKERKLECYRAQKKSERESERKRKFELIKKERFQMSHGRNLFVKNLEDIVNEDVLRKAFEPYGKITSVSIKRENGLSKGFGWVCFETIPEAEKAIKEVGKNKVLPNCSKPLYVAVHEPKELRQSRMMRMRAQKPSHQYYNQTFYGHNFRPNYNPSSGFPQQGFVMQQQGKRQGGGGARKKESLGDPLFSKIYEKEPNLASKITGMIIHSQDFTEEVIKELLNDPNRLQQIIYEAKNHLNTK